MLSCIVQRWPGLSVSCSGLGFADLIGSNSSLFVSFGGSSNRNMNESPEQDYTTQWETLRRQQALFYVTWIGGMFLALGLSLIFRPIGNIFGFLWLAGTFMASIPVGNFCCPRCSKKFFSRPISIGNYYNSFTNKCLNCGLPKWQSHG